MLILLGALVFLPQVAVESRTGLPQRMAFDEPKVQDPGQEPFPPTDRAPATAPQRPVLDLDWFELSPAIGFAVYSTKYRADPAPALTIGAHAPVPWLSPASDPGGEYFGLFAEAAFMTIDRNLSPSVDHRRGLATFFSLGMDYSFLRDSLWILMARAGVLYAYYGDIADLNSGFGFAIGATGGIQISGKLGLTYSPELLFGKSGSLVFLNTLGLSIQF
ncbi:MAG TPA: hypothetical protein VE981_09020 [Planctomycetota bacterium]|nr:hypothetical protein [Planctomycetota bacterium]